MKRKFGIIIILAALILAVGFPGFTLTASAARSESGWSARTFVHVHPAQTGSPTGLSPSLVQKAYNLPSTGGQGTIAIIDAYDDPTVQNDLSVFSTQFGLPGADFEEYKMSSTIRVDSGWALEISLDVQWAHAIAPSAKILLVEAKSNSLGDLLAAVNYAARRSDVVAISMSWGGSEFFSEASYDSNFISVSGATFFASSGDSGAGVIWPSCSSNVVAVGGTTLKINQDGSVSETAWSGSGGGVSAYEAKPAYQVNYGVSSSRRAVPDVSYDADPSTGFPVYDSTAYAGSTGWFQVGGTSAGAPQWAAIQSLGLTASNTNFYQDAKSSAYASYFRDITRGSNGRYSATTGYDCVTGLGSPLATDFTPPPAPPDFSISASPATLNIRSGSSGTSTITVAALNGFSGTVQLAATAPAGLTVTLSSKQITGSGTSTLTIKVASGTRTGTYTVKVTGTSGSLSHSTTVTVRVTRF